MSSDQPSSTRQRWLLVLRVAGIVVLAEAVALALTRLLPGVIGGRHLLLHAAALVLVGTPLLYLTVVRPLARTLAHDSTRHERDRAASMLDATATERRGIQEELRKFRLGTERSKDVVFLTDIDGCIRYVNPAFEQLYGYSEQDVLGATPRMLRSGLVPDALYADLWQKLLAKEVFTGEMVNRTREGRLVTVESSVNPVLDEQGELLGFLAIQRDVSARRRTEQALRASEERLRTLMDKVPEGVGVLALDGTVIYVNPTLCTLIGYALEELMGRGVIELLHPDDRERSAKRIRALLEGAPEAPGEYRLIHKNGHVVPVEIFSRVVEYDAKPALLSTIRDLTHQRRLEEQLRQSQKLEAVGQLAGGIAHDFNNLLTVVLASADLLTPSLSTDDQDAMEDLRQLKKAARRGRDLVQKLLAFGRHEELVLEPLDVGLLVRDFHPTLRRLIPEHIAIGIEIADDLPLAVGNAGSIEQVLVNLCTNARDAMPRGGQLHLSVSAETTDGAGLALGVPKPGNYVCVSVADSGSGMDVTTRERIFEPFFTRKPVGDGTGLGLAVVYGLMKQHGGGIGVESAPEVGTTLRVYLRLAEPTATPAPQHLRTSGPDSLPGGSETLLLVEDEAPLRRSAQRVLERLGYRVIVAQDGLDGLEKLAEHDGEIDLVISDMVMPGLDGRGMLEAARRAGRRMQFLMASGYATGKTEDEELLESGIPFIAKPWTVNELAVKLREVLDGPDVR